MVVRVGERGGRGGIWRGSRTVGEGQERGWRKALAQRGECQGIRSAVGDTCRGSEGGKQGNAVPRVARRRRGGRRSCQRQDDNCPSLGNCILLQTSKLPPPDRRLHVPLLSANSNGKMSVYPNTLHWLISINNRLWSER